MAGVNLTVPADKADCMGQFYSTIFATRFQSQNIAEKEQFIEDQIASPHAKLDKSFSFLEFEDAMHALPSKKASGNDDIPYELIKNLPPSYCQHLFQLFNISWSQSLIPSEWKKSIILPILKPGKDPTSSISYRPISLLVCLCKLFEKMIHTRLSFYLESNNLLSTDQCGFRKGRSTLDQLVQLEHDIRLALATKQTLMVLYIDFKGAFDRVPHLELLHRLAKMGVCGLMLGWIKNFLSGRTFQCFVQGSLSDSFSIETGVPQGSILSPTLFSILLNDLPTRRHNGTSAYADDVGYYLCAPSFTEAYDKMQNVLHDLQVWSKTSGMVINTEKSQYQYFSTKSIIDPIPLKYHNEHITYAKTFKFLGLIFDSPRLTFKDHITNLVNDCSSRMNMLKCVSSHSWGADRHTLTKFYI
jgi:hypothetical protein